MTAGVREGHGKGVSVDRRERGKPIPCSAFPCFFRHILLDWRSVYVQVIPVINKGYFEQ